MTMTNQCYGLHVVIDNHALPWYSSAQLRVLSNMTKTLCSRFIQIQFYTMTEKCQLCRVSPLPGFKPQMYLSEYQANALPI